MLIHRHGWRASAVVVVASSLVLSGGLAAEAASWTTAANAPAPVITTITPSTTLASGTVIGQRLKALNSTKLPVVSVVVQDAATGTVLYHAQDTPKISASTMKVLSSLVSLKTLGAERRFRTSVVTGSQPNQIVLVGGGDPLLQTSRTVERTPGAASLEDLADQTVTALNRSGTTSISLRYDASLFTGPSWMPDWPEAFRRSSVAPITALKVDHAMIDPITKARHASPNQQAAEKFAALLKARGITVDSPQPTKAPADSSPIAEVESPPVATIVEHIQLYSDNDASEALLWLAAHHAGRGASAQAAHTFLAEQLKELGLWHDGMVIADGNGISHNNRVSPYALTGAIRKAMQDPAYRSLITGMPVAGGNGTLAERFEGVGQASGRGVVRAKTGSIRGVSSLAGYVVTADNQVLVFAFMLNDTPSDGTAKEWIDQAASVLASCGC